MLDTIAKSGDRREAPDEMEPVEGTTALTGANTGRFPSPVRKNCGMRLRLRSTVLWPLTLYENPPLMVRIHLPGTRMPSMPRLLRHDIGGSNPGSNTRTSGFEREKVVPFVPSAQDEGPTVMVRQSGTGTASPTQDNVTRVPGRPVDSTNSATVPVLTVPR